MPRLSLETRVQRFRALVDDGIRKCMAKSASCRSYDGQVMLRFPTHMETERKAERYALQLSCSQFVPGRHASWSGRDWIVVFSKAETDVKSWIADTLSNGDEEQK